MEQTNSEVVLQRSNGWNYLGPQTTRSPPVWVKWYHESPACEGTVSCFFLCLYAFQRVVQLWKGIRYQILGGLKNCRYFLLKNIKSQLGIVGSTNMQQKKTPKLVIWYEGSQEGERRNKLVTYWSIRMKTASFNFYFHIMEGNSIKRKIR